MSLSRNILLPVLFISALAMHMNTRAVITCQSNSNGYEIICWPDSLTQSDSLGNVTLPPNDSLNQDSIYTETTNRSIIMLVDSIIEYSKRFIGVPYCSGAIGPDKFDCSGFTSYVFRKFGYELNRTSSGQVADGWKVIDNQNDLQSGDLVFYGGRKNYRSIGHVGIVVENFPEENYFTFIHATVHRGVIISKSNEDYYKIRYIKGCRIIPEYY